MPFAKSLSETQRLTQRGHGAGSTKEKYPLNTSRTKSTTSAQKGSERRGDAGGGQPGRSPERKSWQGMTLWPWSGLTRIPAT